MLSMNSSLTVASAESSAMPIAQRLKRMERINRQLATGRIAPTAADDAFVMSREIKLITKMRSAFQTRLNLNQSMSLAQTADSHLNSLTEPLLRLRELSVMGMSETLTIDDRSIMQMEANELVKTLKGEVERSYFNGHSLFKGQFLQQSTLGLASGTISDQLLTLPKFDFDQNFTIPDKYSDQDIVIALDATGSMQDAIDTLADELGTFVNTLAKDYIGDVRVSLVVYTEGPSILNASPVGLPFEVLEFRELRDASGTTNEENLSYFTNYLDHLTTSGGVEDLKGVIEYIDDNFAFKADAKQQIVVIGSSGDEANDRPGAVEAVKNFVSSNEDRTVSAISVNNTANGLSEYFRDDLVPAGKGSFIEFEKGDSLTDQLVEAIASERQIESFSVMSSRKSKDGWYWVEHFLNLIDTTRSSIAGFQSGLEYQLALRESDLVEGEGSLARLTSADIADLTMKLSRDQSMLQSEVTLRGEMINTFGGALLEIVDSLA